MSGTQTKICITGGHVTPALAVIDELTARHPDWAIVFIGRTYALEKERHPSSEYKIISARGIPFLPIAAGRLLRVWSVTSVISLLKVPVGLVQALGYCLRERPALIVSFGGYVGLPVVIAGWMLGIPSITHEQTMVPGLANRIIARFARKICYSFPGSGNGLPKEKTILTGLPLRATLFGSGSRPGYLNASLGVPLLYITGGSTGASSLNDRLFPALARLLVAYQIVHQTGDVSMERARTFQSGLPSDLQKRYHVVPYVPDSDLAWILGHARLVIGRSGANTVMELAALAKPAVFIPLPWSGGGEQVQNALWLQNQGSARVIAQESLTPQILTGAVQELARQRVVMEKRALELAKRIPRDAASKIVREIELIVVQ